MKLFVSMIISFSFLFALNPMILPIKGVDVVHTYSNGKKESIKIQREDPLICSQFGITPENFQSGNIASKNIPLQCKKTFITTKGVIQPFTLYEGIKTVAELEVLEFIQEKAMKEPEKYILVDSRRNDWFDMGTIPSAVNIPYDEYKLDEDFKEEYKRAYKLLGVKLKNKKYDFSDAKTVMFFCNGAWCAQSPKAIDILVRIGYPKKKILWYRGGIASWVGVSLTLTKNIEAIK